MICIRQGLTDQADLGTSGGPSQGPADQADNSIQKNGRTTQTKVRPIRQTVTKKRTHNPSQGPTDQANKYKKRTHNPSQGTADNAGLKHKPCMLDV